MVAVMDGCQAWEAEGTGEGAATGVLVVHGFTGNPRSTTPTARSLNAQGWTVAVPRLPGHGTEVRDMARTRYADWYGEVDRALTELRSRVDRVVVVGLSMGGTLALDVASSRPADVDGVVVINPQVLSPEQLLARIAPILQHVVPLVPRDAAGLPSDDIAKPDADEGAYAMVPAKAAQSLVRRLPALRRQLGRLTQPLLVAYAPKDHTVPAANAEALPGLVGSEDVTLLRLERSYHVATLDWDAPLLEREVDAFVAKVHAAR